MGRRRPAGSAGRRPADRRAADQRIADQRIADQRGAVTAEAVMVLPVLTLVTIAMCWLVGVGVQQARIVDAARETARLVARDVPQSEAVAAGRRVAPEGARISVRSSGDEVSVTVSLVLEAPGGIGSASGTLTSTAVAAKEGGG